MPGTTLLKRNIPSEVDTVIRTAPIAVSFNSTDAPGTAALLGSVTVPCKVALVVCANAQPHKTAAVSTAKSIRCEFITDLPPTKFHSSRARLLLRDGHPRETRVPDSAAERILRSS